MPKGKCSEAGNNCFQDYYQQHCCYNEPWMIKYEAKVKEHPNGNEEETCKDILEWYEVAERAAAVLRVGDHQSGQKRSESKRHAQLMCQHCNGKAKEKDAHKKELLAVGHRYQMQKFGHQPLIANIYEYDYPRGFKQQHQQLISDICCCTTEHGSKEQQRYQNNILKDKYPDHGFSIMGGQLRPLLQELKHHCSTAESSKETDKDRLSPAKLIDSCYKQCYPCCQQQLHEAAQKDYPADIKNMVY